MIIVMFWSKMVYKNTLTCLDTSLHKMATQEHTTLGTKSLYLEAGSLLKNDPMNSVKNNTWRWKRKMFQEGILANKFWNYCSIGNKIAETTLLQVLKFSSIYTVHDLLLLLTIHKVKCWLWVMVILMCNQPQLFVV